MNLKQLSAELGLSQTTVSRALNGFPEVNALTRAKVVEAARRLNYRPNMRARGLATGRAMAIGHVIPVSSKHEMVNPVFADIIAGAGEVYSAADYDMVLSVVSDAEEADAYRRFKAKGMVDGVILHAPRRDDPRIAFLSDLGLPFVVHGRAGGADAPYSWLDMDNRGAFGRATGFLIDLGHRRIALVNGDEELAFALDRRQGYEAALAGRGLPCDPGLMSSTDMTEQDGYQAAGHALRASDPPTAFLTSSVIMAIGVRRAVEERGLKLGRDISIITHDDRLSYFSNGEDMPLFTSTRQSAREAGRLAARMLLDLIANPDQSPRNQMLDAPLIVGQSTGPRQAHFDASTHVAANINPLY